MGGGCSQVGLRWMHLRDIGTNMEKLQDAVLSLACEAKLFMQCGYQLFLWQATKKHPGRPQTSPLNLSAPYILFYSSKCLAMHGCGSSS